MSALTRLKYWLLEVVATIFAACFVIPYIVQVEEDYSRHQAGTCDGNSCFYCHEDGVCDLLCTFCLAL